MTNHSVNVSEQATTVSTPTVAESGIPFVVGVAPVQLAEHAAKVGVPVLCTSWDEAVSMFGYSDDWETYSLCEFMFSHFKLYACQPVIFCNALDITKAKKAVQAADISVKNHKAIILKDAINDESLIVKKGSATLTKDTDYATYYNGENLIIELLADGTAYDAETVNVAYNKVDASVIKTDDIVTAIESIELCLTKLGVVPDLICAPGYSDDSTVAAVMAAKSSNINGLFSAKPIIDVSTASATKYSDVLGVKNENNLTDKNEIVCWPMVKSGDKVFHLSTHIAGVIARTDIENGGCPYESPSNKNIQCDGLVLEDGSEVNLTLTQANQLNSNGVITALNFVNGWVVWGNYTGCYPSNTDVKDGFIPVNRMFGWVGNTIIKTFWSKLDKPMTRRLVDTVLDTANIWLNGLVGQGYLLGARVIMEEDENPLDNLMAGIIKLHVYLTPPSPAQEIDFVLEYDAKYVTSAFQS